MSPEEFKALQPGDVIGWDSTVVRVVSGFHQKCVGIEYPSGTEEPLHICSCYEVDKK